MFIVEEMYSFAKRKLFCTSCKKYIFPHKYFPALKVRDSWWGNEEKRSSRVLLRLLQLLKSSSWSQDIQMFRVQLGSNSPGLDPQPSLNGATGRYQLRNVGNVRFCRSWICRNLPHYVFHWKYLVSFSQTRLLLNLQMMQLHLEQWSLGWLAVWPPASPPPSPITISTNLNKIMVLRNVKC